MCSAGEWSAAAARLISFDISRYFGQMPRSLSWRVAIDETEISGDIGRSQTLAQGQRLPTEMYSMSYGDVFTAWDRPEPTKWRHTVPCSALEP